MGKGTWGMWEWEHGNVGMGQRLTSEVRVAANTCVDLPAELDVYESGHHHEYHSEDDEEKTLCV